MDHQIPLPAQHFRRVAVKVRETQDHVERHFGLAVFERAQLGLVDPRNLPDVAEAIAFRDSGEFERRRRTCCVQPGFPSKKKAPGAKAEGFVSDFFLLLAKKKEARCFVPLPPH